MCLIDTVLRIEKVYRLLLHIMKIELSKMSVHDLHPTQALLLYKIGKNVFSIGELMNHDLFLGTNISYNVKKLVELDYLCYQKPINDQRTTLIGLTKKGLRFWKRITQTLNQHECDIFPLYNESLQPDVLLDQVQNVERYFCRMIGDISGIQSVSAKH